MSSPLYCIVGLINYLQSNTSILFIVGHRKTMQEHIPLIVGLKNGGPHNISPIMSLWKGLLPNMALELSYNQTYTLLLTWKAYILSLDIRKGKRRTISLIVSQINKNTTQCYMFMS
jgi:hypothetical protein